MSNKTPSQRPWIIALLVVIAIGLIDTTFLIREQFNIAEQGLMGKSFCTVNDLIDCAPALTSSYSKVWRIPNAELGFLFFLILGILTLWALVSEERRCTIFQFLSIFSGLSLIYAFYMSYILLAVLGALCLFCLASHLMTLIATLLIFRLANLKEWSLSFQKAIVYLSVSTLILSVGLLFFFGMSKKAHSADPEFNRAALIKHFYAQKPATFDVSDRPMWGNPEAKVTIVDFSDFQCPFCRRAAFTLKPYLSEYKKDVRLIYMHYPLDNACNPKMNRPAHPAACLAARASMCIYQQKGDKAFWDYHDLVFENQKKLSHHLLTRDLATDVGMAHSALTECMTAEATNAAVLSDIEQGVAAGVGGTPALYINGRYFRSWTVPALLRTIIEEEIKRSKNN